MRILLPTVIILIAAAMHAQTPSPALDKGLTAVEGVKVGHYTMPGRPTGCTVVLFEPPAVASVDVRGSAPATKETDLLEPRNLVQQVNAFVLSGGSAFGLDSATGVMRYLEEHGQGYPTTTGPVPIVPAASLIDLWFGGDPKIRPNADCGYRAAQAASTDPVQEGNVGAGAGASVGKLLGTGRATKAGIGTSAIMTPDGLVVAALVAVNAVGDIIDPSTGRVIAGIRTEDGKSFADARTLIKSGIVGRPLGARDHTTLAIVATNATLTKVQMQKVAQMAADGVARAITPAHTPYDGDTVFAAATGRWKHDANLLVVGALAADAVAQAIVRAATQAESLGGLPAARDINK